MPAPSGEPGAGAAGEAGRPEGRHAAETPPPPGPQAPEALAAPGAPHSPGLWGCPEPRWPPAGGPRALAGPRERPVQSPSRLRLRGPESSRLNRLQSLPRGWHWGRGPACPRINPTPHPPDCPRPRHRALPGPEGPGGRGRGRGGRMGPVGGPGPGSRPAGPRGPRAARGAASVALMADQAHLQVNAAHARPAPAAPFVVLRQMAGTGQFRARPLG